MKINYVALVILLAIIGSIIYIVYDVHYRGPNELGELWLTASNKLIIMYIFTVFIGSAGISLISTYANKLLQDRRNHSSFQTVEAVFIRNIVSRDADTPTKHIYEYYVNGKCYECEPYIFETPWSKIPKNITIRYNSKNPEEVMTTKENRFGLVAGILCIGLVVLLIYGSTKIEFEGGRSVYEYLIHKILIEKK